MCISSCPLITYLALICSLISKMNWLTSWSVTGSKWNGPAANARFILPGLKSAVVKRHALKTKAFLWHISRICYRAFFAFSLFFYFVLHGSRWIRKNGKKKGTLSPLGDPPPKRVKRGHLLSDYRQKCVNATRDMLMSKARKMTILTITMFNENVHTGCLFLTGTS